MLPALADSGNHGRGLGGLRLSDNNTASSQIHGHETRTCGSARTHRGPVLYKGRLSTQEVGAMV